MDWSAFNAVLLAFMGVGFIAWLFDKQAEQDRKTDERTRGNYCVNWRRHDDGLR